MRSGGLKRGIILALAAFMLAAVTPFTPASASTYDAARPDLLVSDNLRAESAIVIEQDSGEVLFEHNADELKPPASTTKVMTVLLAILMSNPEDIVTVSPYAAAVPEDASKIGLQAGEQVVMRDLIRATMVASGNDGAIAIAEHISGSETAFVSLMNEAAYRYGCTRTNFVNPHGYHDDYHLSTARDLAIITREAMQNKEFREIATLTSYTLPQTNLSEPRRVSSQAVSFLVQGDGNSNYYQYATGVKTGQTSLAGYCFIGSASKQGIRLISVVLKSGSTARWTDTRRLMEYGFSQFISTSVSEIYNQNPKIINITGFSLQDEALGRLELAIRKVNPTDNDALVTPKGKVNEQMQLFQTRTRFEFTRKLDAPVEAGEVIGVMTYTPLAAGADPVEYELIATRDIIRRASLAPTMDEIKAYTEADPNPFPRFSLEFLIIMLLPVTAVILLSQAIFRLITRKRKPRLKQKLEYKTRYYR
jgi:D-alanyl-D-alanine carboxypeptidase